MKPVHIGDNWEELRQKLKWNFRHLTDQDLKYTKGKEKELVTRLQQKLGNRREEVIEILNRLIK
jgi:uncharacterized protein YjbJ (UPF0337 family)